MGDYKPEIVYENANVVELDPRDEAAIAKVNAECVPQLVTVKDDVDLPLIAAFRLLATRLQPRHAILLKDILKNDEAPASAELRRGRRMTNDEGMTNLKNRNTRDASFVIRALSLIQHSTFVLVIQIRSAVARC